MFYFLGAGGDIVPCDAPLLMICDGDPFGAQVTDPVLTWASGVGIAEEDMRRVYAHLTQTTGWLDVVALAERRLSTDYLGFLLEAWLDAGLIAFNTDATKVRRVAESR